MTFSGIHLYFTLHSSSALNLSLSLSLCGWQSLWDHTHSWLEKCMASSKHQPAEKEGKRDIKRVCDPVASSLLHPFTYSSLSYKQVFLSFSLFNTSLSLTHTLCSPFSLSSSSAAVLQHHAAIVISGAAALAKPSQH